MKNFLKSIRNFIFMSGLSLILFSCTTTVVIPSNSEASPTGAPTRISTGAPTVESTRTPPRPLDVDVDVVFDDCNCSGNFKNAIINLTINNGEAPFNISGNNPVYPNKDNQVSFPVSVGSFIPLEITSSDGLYWKTEKNIDTSPPYSCQPPPSCTSGGKNNGKNCHEEEVETCESVEVKKKVCVDWAGNSGKCKKWDEIVTHEDVCTKTVEEVCK